MSDIRKRTIEERLLILEGQVEVMLHFIKDQGSKIKKLEDKNK